MSACKCLQQWMRRLCLAMELKQNEQEVTNLPPSLGEKAGLSPAVPENQTETSLGGFEQCNSM